MRMTVNAKSVNSSANVSDSARASQLRMLNSLVYGANLTLGYCVMLVRAKNCVENHLLNSGLICSRLCVDSIAMCSVLFIDCFCAGGDELQRRTVLVIIVPRHYAFQPPIKPSCPKQQGTQVRLFFHDVDLQFRRRYCATVLAFVRVEICFVHF